MTNRAGPSDAVSIIGQSLSDTHGLVEASSAGTRSMRSVVQPAEAVTGTSGASIAPPENFHQAAHAVLLDDAQPASIRFLALFSSAIIVALQLVTLMAAYRSNTSGSCLTNDHCYTRGTYCRASISICDDCKFGPDPIAACGPNVTAEAWLASLPPRSLTTSMAWDGPTTADYAPHCSACVDADGRYIWASTVFYKNVKVMGLRDWLGLTVVSAIIGLFVAREVRDVKLCEVLARSRSTGIGWQLSVGFVSSVRQIAVVASLELSVLMSVFSVGGGVLSVCLNAVALLFLLEIDDILYLHVVPEWAKVWCSKHALVMLHAADSRVINWLRIAYALMFMACIPGVAARRLSFPIEVAKTYVSECLWSVAVPGMLLASVAVEPMALRSSRPEACRRLGLCLLRFVIGLLVWSGALQLI